MSSAADLMHVREDLDPELQEYLFEDETLGACIKHPLVYSIMHRPEMNAIYNNALRVKKAEIERHRAEGNWAGVIVLHERAWRLFAFQEIADELSDRDYWSTLGWLWTDSENIWENEAHWIEALEAERPNRHFLMDEGDRSLLDFLPADPMTIYRGFTVEGRERGLSWSLRRDKAEWFANRWRYPGRFPGIAVGRVARKDIIAFFTTRGEYEIVAFPEDIEIIDIKEVPE